jgi:hypothetical protein
MRRKPLFPPPQDQDGRKQRNKGTQTHSVLTINGRITLARRLWHSAREGTTAPLDSWVDAAEATVSLGVRELACRLNQNSSNFDKTAENLARAAQVHSSGETLRQLIEAEGRGVLEKQRRGQLPPNWTAADCRLPDGITRVYFGSDGVKVPMVTEGEKKKRRQKVKQKRRQRGKKARPLPPAKAGADQKYKEFKIVAYYDETQKHCHASVTSGDCQVAGRLMRRDACRLQLQTAQEKVGNVDGAAWIRNQVQVQAVPLDALGLDFYHLAEHVHQARRLVFGEENDAGRAWAGEVLHRFKHEGYDGVWEALMTWRGALRRSKRQAADALLHYVAERRDMIRYPEFVQRGWQIGSGPTEALCKTTTARLKGSGMRWNKSSAEAVMALAALEQSGLWKDYWRTCLQLAG